MTIRRSFVATTTVLVVLLAPAAIASASDACPPLDATCVVEGAVQENPNEPIQGLQDEVNKDAGDVTRTVQETLDGALPGGGDLPPGGGAGGDEGRSDQRGDGSRDEPGGPNVNRGPAQSRSPAGPSTRTPVNRRTGLDDGLIDVPGVSVDRRTSSTPSLAQRIAQVAIPGVGLILVLLGTVAGFVLVQDRLDRKDPKLALAPVETDIVEFA